jgi:hypothetical protein
MPNPLWVDARDYLTNKGVPVTTGNLNSAMGFLAQNVNARPSYAKASPDAATSIGAGLGMPTDDLAAPIDDPSFQNSAQYIPNAVGSSPQMRGSAAAPTTGVPPTIKATPLAGPTLRPSPRPTRLHRLRLAHSQGQQGTPNRTEKTASTRSQPKALPVNNRTETASARSDPIVSPVSTGSDPNIHGTPANVAPALPANVNPAIPDVSNGAYAPGGLRTHWSWALSLLVGVLALRCWGWSSAEVVLGESPMLLGYLGLVHLHSRCSQDHDTLPSWLTTSHHWPSSHHWSSTCWRTSSCLHSHRSSPPSAISSSHSASHRLATPCLHPSSDDGTSSSEGSSSCAWTCACLWDDGGHPHAEAQEGSSHQT